MKRQKIKRKNPAKFASHLSPKALTVYEDVGYKDSFGRKTEIPEDLEDLYFEAEIWLEKAIRQYDRYNQYHYEYDLEKYKKYLEKANLKLEELYSKLKDEHKMRYSTSRKPTRRRNPGENLVVASKVKEVIKAHGMRASAEVIEALSDKIRDKIEKGVARAKANKRQTLRAEDI